MQIKLQVPTQVNQKKVKEFDEKSKCKLKIPKERYIQPEKRQQIIDELKLKLHGTHKNIT